MLNENVALKWLQTYLDYTEKNKQSEHDCGRFQTVTAQRDKAYQGVPCESNLRKPLLEYMESEYVISEGRDSCK